MEKAMDKMGVSSLGCYAHSLQLVVNKGLLSQRSVSDAVANARAIVKHFKKSPLASSQLNDIQVQMQIQTEMLTARRKNTVEQHVLDDPESPGAEAHPRSLCC